MSIKLTALALGITLAYGATSAMANEATVEQNGAHNNAVIEQWGGNESATASISSFGNFNDATIEQKGNESVVAAISTTGDFNDAVVVQTLVDNSSATINQTAYAGDATITQTGSQGSWWNRGTGDNQHATINQAAGYGNEAWVTQTGDRTVGDIYQSGLNNVAGIEQDGSGYGYVTARINQVGSYNDGYISQDGRNLMATVNQTGFGHEATILQQGSGYTASVTQVGFSNNAYVNQR